MKEPLVYIITINWNGFEDTKELLASIKKLKYKNYRVVVIDNGSEKNDADKLVRLFPDITVIKNKKNLGYVIANNQGVTIALKRRADYTFWLNNDTVVKKDSLKKLVDYAEKHKNIGLYNSKILYFHSNKIWAMGGKLPFYTGIPRMIGQGKSGNLFRSVTHPDYASGCALLVNSLVIRSIGLLNPVYFANYEDTDFSFRAKRAGFNIAVIPDSLVWHKVSRSTKQKNLSKIGTIASYLLAKNGLIFGYFNFRGIKLYIYLFNQLITKFILYLLLKCEDNKARLSYSHGLIDGIRYIFQKRTNESKTSYSN